MNTLTRPEPPMRQNIDDDEPPTLVEVVEDDVSANVDMGGLSLTKVPITIVTGYLGAGSEKPLS